MIGPDDAIEAMGYEDTSEMTEGQLADYLADLAMYEPDFD